MELMNSAIETMAKMTHFEVSALGARFPLPGDTPDERGNSSREGGD
jgi:hypothetical protein